MAQVKYHRDSKGLAEILKSAEVAKEIGELSEIVAGQIEASTGSEVVIDEYVTDRAAASLLLLDRNAMALQAKFGVMTRAAAAVGLEVKSKK